MMASHCTLKFDAKVKENGCHNQVKETKVVLSTDFLEWGWGLNTEISGFWKQPRHPLTAVAPPKNCVVDLCDISTSSRALHIKYIQILILMLLVLLCHSGKVYIYLFFVHEIYEMLLCHVGPVSGAPRAKQETIVELWGLLSDWSHSACHKDHALKRINWVVTNGHTEMCSSMTWKSVISIHFILHGLWRAHVGNLWQSCMRVPPSKAWYTLW